MTSDEEMERNLGEWRRIVLYECDGLNLYTRKYQMNKKSGIMPPKPLKRIIFWSEVKEVYGVATISTSWELQFILALTYDVFEAIFVILNYASVHVNYELLSICSVARKIRIKRSVFFIFMKNLQILCIQKALCKWLVRTKQGGFPINIQCDY